MDSLYATARGIHEELEHVLDARDRLEALSSHDFVERVEMQVMGLLAKQVCGVSASRTECLVGDKVGFIVS